MIPAASWNMLKLAMQALPNVSVFANQDFEKEILWLTTSPPWLVELGEKWFAVSQGPKTNAYIVGSIPGADYVLNKKMYKVPLTEGWRLAEALNEVEGVVYTDEAQDYIVKQIEGRAAVDMIPGLEDAPDIMDALTNVVTIDGITQTVGQHLKPFQRVGVTFLNAIQGRGLLTDEMGLGKSPQAMCLAEYRKHKKVLVICPANLKPNWARQIMKWTNERPYTLSGADPSDFDMKKMILDTPRWSIINYDILGRKTEYDAGDEGRGRP